jgi:hypothetical protein
VPTVPVILESGEVGLYLPEADTMSLANGPSAGKMARMLYKPDGSDEQLGWHYENDEGLWTELQ